MGRLETFGGKQMDGLAGLSFVMATVAFCGAQTREGGSHQIIRFVQQSAVYNIYLKLAPILWIQRLIRITHNLNIIHTLLQRI